MAELVAELRDILERGGTNWYGYNEVSLAVKKLDEHVKEKRYEKIPDAVAKIEAAIYKAVPKLKQGMVEKRMGYMKLKAKLFELANPVTKSQEKDSNENVMILIESIQRLAHTLWDNDHEVASPGPSRSSIIQSLDYIERRVGETGRVLRRIDRVKRDMITIYNTLRMKNYNPRDRVIADRKDVTEDDSIEDICTKVMKISESIVEAPSSETNKLHAERVAENVVDVMDKNDLKHIKEWVEWLDASLRYIQDSNEVAPISPETHKDKRAKHRITMSDNAAKAEIVIRFSVDHCKQLKQQCEALEASRQQIEEKLNETIAELQKENALMMKDIENHKKEIPTYQSRPSSVQSYDQDSIQGQVYQLKHEKRQLHDQLQEAITQKKYWMKRLSDIAGSKLAGNVGLADLSDPNRPQKLAERFSELYHNEWTEALEKLTGNDPTKHKDAVLQLATILKLSYHHCDNTSEEQMSRMKEILFNLHGVSNHQNHKKIADDVSEEKVKAVKDLQKLAAPNSKEEVLLIFHEKLKKNKMNHTLETIPRYLQECVEICWFMTVNDPKPVFLWPDETKSEILNVDLDKFAYFTEIGDRVDYVVWPAMLAEVDGALLRKGVVQPVPTR